MQTPVTILDSISTIAIGASKESNGVPVVGMSRIYGLLWGSADGTVEIWQGVNDQGSLQYRHVDRYKFSDKPTMTVPIDLPVLGKFVQVRILNNLAGVPINVECAVLARESY